MPSGKKRIKRAKAAAAARAKQSAAESGDPIRALDSRPILSVYSMPELCTIASPVSTHSVLLPNLGWSKKLCLTVLQFSFDSAEILLYSEQLIATVSTASVGSTDPIDWSLAMLRARASLYDARGERFFSGCDHRLSARFAERINGGPPSPTAAAAAAASAAATAAAAATAIAAPVTTVQPLALTRSVSALPWTESAADAWLSAARSFDAAFDVSQTLFCLERAQRVLMPPTTGGGGGDTKLSSAAATTATAASTPKSPKVAAGAATSGSPKTATAAVAAGRTAVTPVIHRQPTSHPTEIEFINQMLAPYHLECVMSSNGGRFLRTLTARRAGDIAFIEEPIHSWTPLATSTGGQYCAHCARAIHAAAEASAGGSGAIKCAVDETARRAVGNLSPCTVPCDVRYCSVTCQRSSLRYHPFLCGRMRAGHSDAETNRNGEPFQFLPLTDPDYSIVNAQLISVAHALARMRCHPTQPHQPAALSYGVGWLQTDTSKPPAHLTKLNKSSVLHKRMDVWYRAFIRELGLDERSCSVALFDQLFSVCDVNEWGLATSNPDDEVYQTSFVPAPTSAAAAAAAAASDEEEIIPTGCGSRMGLFASLFNHSCTPNMTMLDEAGAGATPPPPPSTHKFGHYFIPRFTKDTKAGDECTVSYVDPNEADVNVRAIKLASYGFRCGCNRCVTQMRELPGGVLSAQAIAHLQLYGL